MGQAIYISKRLEAQRMSKDVYSKDGRPHTSKLQSISYVYLDFQPKPSTQKVNSLSVEGHLVGVESHEG